MKIYTQRIDKKKAMPIRAERIALSFDIRQKSRFALTLKSGEGVGVDLPRTGVIRDGDIIATEHNEFLIITAAKQTVMQATAAASFTLLKAAYHLGNRHVPLMLTPSALYFEPDHVLAEMIIGFGLTVETIDHPFEPESGAYQHHQHETRLKPFVPVSAST